MIVMREPHKIDVVNTENNNLSEQGTGSAKEQAFFWVARLSSIHVNDRDQQLFAEWLAASPEHQELFDEARRLWSKTGELDDLKQKYPLEDKEWFDREWRREQRRSGGAISFLRWASVIKVAAVGALTATIVLVAVTSLWTVQPASIYSTANGQSQTVTLADGSIVSLSAGTQIAVEYTEDRRNIELVRGEAFFDVVSAPERPFIVRSGDEIIKVVGTMFNVHAAQDRVTVSVLEGAVKLAHREFDFLPMIEMQDSYPAGTLRAGEALEVHEGTQLTAVKTVQETQIASWRYGVLTFVEVPLARVVSDMNRHFASKIQIVDNQIGNLQVTAVFQMDDLNTPLRMLEQILPISVSRGDDQRITLSRERN